MCLPFPTTNFMSGSDSAAGGFIAQTGKTGG